MVILSAETRRGSAERSQARSASGRRGPAMAGWKDEDPGAGGSEFWLEVWAVLVWKAA